jgi:hypothetical protein
MATLGTVKSANNKKAVCLLDPNTVGAQAAPSGTPSPGVAASVTNGVPMYPRVQFDADDSGHCFVNRDARESTLLVSGFQKAVLAIDGPASATWNTIVQAVPMGETLGEAVTLTATADGTGTGSFTVVGTAVTFHYETAVTLVSDFEAGLAADEEVAALLTLNTAGTTQAYALLVGDDDFGATPLVYSTGALAATLTLWGYLEASECWYEIPTSTGTPITPVALAETGTDTITLVQRFQNLGHFDRIGLQVASLVGTGASFEAWLVTGLAGTGA